MRNVKPFSNDCFKIFIDAVNRKNVGVDKSSLLSIKKEIEGDYNIYKNKFIVNDISSINPNILFTPHKERLQSLYDYQNKAIRDIRKNIEDCQIETIRYTCQNCSLDSVSTMDHVLPQSQYPEFAINAYNLFPCCSICNTFKNKAIKDGEGNDIFLNLFLDILPEEQYLFVNIIVDENNEIDFQFYLSNVNMIDPAIYNRIKSHFKKLYLLDRMRNKAISSLTELRNLIETMLKYLPIDTIKSAVIDNANKEKEAYGYNYWKSVLYVELVNNDLFMIKF